MISSKHNEFIRTKYTHITSTLAVALLLLANPRGLSGRGVSEKESSDLACDSVYIISTGSGSELTHADIYINE